MSEPEKHENRPFYEHAVFKIAAAISPLVSIVVVVVAVVADLRLWVVLTLAGAVLLAGLVAAGVRLFLNVRDRLRRLEQENERSRRQYNELAGVFAVHALRPLLAEAEWRGWQITYDDTLQRFTIITPAGKRHMESFRGSVNWRVLSAVLVEIDPENWDADWVPPELERMRIAYEMAHDANHRIKELEERPKLINELAQRLADQQDLKWTRLFHEADERGWEGRRGPDGTVVFTGHGMRLTMAETATPEQVWDQLAKAELQGA